MNNQDILKALQKNRQVTAFAKYIGYKSPRALYKTMQSTKRKDNQYYNLVCFLLDRFINKTK